jgi:hypothetical protein
MNNDIVDPQEKPRNNGKVFAGMVLLVVGSILLLKQFDYFDIPGWIWSWPTWLIVWGLYIGAKHNFRNPGWFFLIFIGVLGMLDYAVPILHLTNFIWPLIIIMLGIWIILKRNHSWDKKNWKNGWDDKWNNKWEWRDNQWQLRNTPDQTPPDTGSDPAAASTEVPPVDPQFARYSGDDVLDAVSIFGGVKKTILSKTFKGGDIVNIFGGSEIDLTQADINGRVVLDITQVFGGTKIIVPPHWQVVSDLAAVFAGVDDKRLRRVGSGDTTKVLVLKGVSIFAGVDIRSY